MSHKLVIGVAALEITLIAADLALLYNGTAAVLHAAGVDILSGIDPQDLANSFRAAGAITGCAVGLIPSEDPVYGISERHPIAGGIMGSILPVTMVANATFAGIDVIMNGCARPHSHPRPRPRQNTRW